MVFDETFSVKGNEDDLERFRRVQGEASFQYCVFDGLDMGDLAGKNFQNCIFRNCSFRTPVAGNDGSVSYRPSNLSRVVMTNCLVSGSGLSGVNCVDFSMTDTNFVNCDLSGSSMLGVSFERGRLEKCNVNGMVLDGVVAGTEFNSLRGKAFANTALFEMDEVLFDRKYSVDAFRSLVQKEVNRNTSYVNAFYNPVTKQVDREKVRKFLERVESDYRKNFESVRTFLDKDGNVREFSSPDEKKAYVDSRVASHMVAVNREIRDSFLFMRMYNSSLKRKNYVDRRSRELFESSVGKDIEKYREFCNQMYRSSCLDRLNGSGNSVDKPDGLRMLDVAEAERQVLRFRDSDEAVRSHDAEMYIQAAIEKTKERRAYAARDWSHIRKQEAAVNREREDMTHDRDVTDLRDRRKEYTDKISSAKEAVRDAAAAYRKTKLVAEKGKNEPVVPFKFVFDDLTPDKPTFICSLVDDAYEGTSKSLANLDNNLRILREKVAGLDGFVNYRVSYDGDGNKKVIPVQGHRPGVFDGSHLHGVQGVVRNDDKETVVNCGIFLRKNESVSFRVSNGLSTGHPVLVVEGECKPSTLEALKSFFGKDRMFFGVGMTEVSLQKERLSALRSAISSSKQAIDEFKDWKKGKEYVSKNHAEEDSKLFSVKHSNLDYSGDVEQYDRFGNSGASADGDKVSFNYRFYIPAGSSVDRTGLYETLDEIEDGKDALLFSKVSVAESMVEVPGSGFSLVPGSTEIRGVGSDTVGVVGKFVKRSSSVVVSVCTDNASDNGYFEMKGTCLPEDVGLFKDIALHGALFDGLSVYCPDKKKKFYCLGKNDGSGVVLGQDASDGSSLDVDGKGAPVVDFSDVGRKSGKDNGMV